MASKLEFTQPFNDLNRYVPQNLRNSVVRGLLGNLFNRFMTQDESAPFFGYAGRRPSSTDDRSPRVPQATSERDINAITPVLSFRVGAELVTFTVQDLLAKADRMGIGGDSQSWLYSQGNNFTPPIDFDKFSSFFNYYWVAKAVTSTPEMSWNPEKLPEYYVIARPSPTDAVKLSCRTSSGPGEQFVLTGSGFIDQVFTLTFTSPTQFTLQAGSALTGPLGSWEVSSTGTDYAGSVAPTSVDVAARRLTFTLPPLPTPSGTPVPTTERETSTFRFIVRRSGAPSDPVTLVEFKVTREATYDELSRHDGYTGYEAGDVIGIDTTYLSSTWSATFSGAPGLRPILGGVKAYDTYQTIGGVQVRPGDRVLIQGPTSAAGIYVVADGAWERAADFTDGTWLSGARTFVTSGTYASTLWEATGAPGTWGWTQVGTQPNTSDWQEANFWVKGSDLQALGIEKSQVIQATRPIIEYSAQLQLNGRVEAGVPVDWTVSGTRNYVQRRTEFNQLPLFDLFRYDGTHANRVSSIFYYVEDLTAELDVALQRRVKRANNVSRDFLFNHGCISDEGHLLFFKQAGDLKTVWHAGYIEPTVVDVTALLAPVEQPGSRTFTGGGNGVLGTVTSSAQVPPQTLTITFLTASVFEVVGSTTGSVGTGSVGTAFTSLLASFTITPGTTPFTVGATFTLDLVQPGTLSAVTAGDLAQQQVWTVRCVSPSTFEVAGSKTAVIPSPQNTATVGVPYTNGEVSFTITSTVAPFSVGDTFMVRIGALERPRYVFRQEDDTVTDFFGGPGADAEGVGAYQVPRTFIHNPYSDNRSEVTEGVTYSHFRSILANQVQGQPMDLSFGGEIKLWGEQHALLASLLMQRDLTPISMVDLAKRLYEAGLNAIRDIYITRVVDYFSQVSVDAVSGVVPTPAEQARVTALLDWVLDIRANDEEVRRVLFDSTSGVPGIPTTLPQLGISALVEPFYAFDRVLGREIFIHHDGHSSVPYVDGAELRQEILGSYVDRLVERSDGTSTPAIGSFTATAPASPYKGTLWLLPSGELRAFDVTYDTPTAPPAPADGETWFKRAGDILHVASGGVWVPQPASAVDAAWKTVNLAATLNELIFQTEKRLHQHINPNQRRFDFSVVESNASYQQQLQRELFTFAAREGLDPLATNYNPQDPFTWNYRSAFPAAFPPLSTTTVPARWYNVLVAHQQTVAGVIPTERPNLEPWKLLGFSSFSTWWASLTPSQQATFRTGITLDDLSTFTDGGEVRAVATSHVAALSGLPTIDGVSLNPGDLVLLSNQLSPLNNGLWVVALGGWARVTTGLVNRYFKVTEGLTRGDTTWAVTDAGIPGVDPTTIVQVREWSDAFWSYVLTQRPSLRLSVDPFTDDLLPPYVSPSSPVAPYALTTGLPTGISQPFLFGEGSPVEEVWERSIEYGYAQAKALFRFDPLAFIGFCWGFNWVEVDGILYDGADVSMPGPRRFRLHGDPVTPRVGPTLNVTSVTSTTATYTITYDAYDTNRRQNFSVRASDGVIVGFIVEGVTTSITLSDGITLTGPTPLIEDRGIPFRTGDTFTLTVDGGTFTSTFTAAASHRILGFGQVFTNALREVSIDSQSSYATTAFRAWDVNMGHRAGGLVVTDDLKVATETDSLSSASYDLVFKRSEGMRDLWLQGLRVVLVERGTTSFDPVAPGSGPAERPFPNSLPGNAAEDWVFRIEGYNPSYLELPYYLLEGLPGGTSFPASPALNDRFYRHDEAQPYQWDGTQWVPVSANLQTFNALDQQATSLTWYQPLTSTGLTVARLPVTVTGLQNVITLLFGYERYLTEQGWVFDSSTERRIDETTGRNRSWQLEVELLVDAVFQGIEVGQGQVFNPFIDVAQLSPSTGLLAPFTEVPLFDLYSHAAAYDVLGQKIAATDLVVERSSAISTVRSSVPIFSLHALVDEYEHLFIFRNFISTSERSGSLYDPFSGGRVVTYKFNGRRQGTGSLRPELGGHYLVGNEVRLNLQASTNALATAYDPDHAFESTLLSDHAFALLGFSRKDYLSDLDITDRSQFNFWRGLIQSKGTNLSIDAYLNNDRFKEARIDEYWAYKVAEYGDARQRTFPELRLRVEDAFQQYTLLQFDAPEGVTSDGSSPGQLPSFTQVSRFDEDRWFSIDDLDQDTYFKAEVVGVFSQVVTPGQVVTVPFIADALDGVGATFTRLNATTLVATSAGTLVVTGYGPAAPRFSPVKLFNYVDDQLIEELPLWHPAVGQHTPTALESINTISDTNPARYTYSTLVDGNSTYDPLRPWGDREVGRVWFDTRNLAFVPYYDASIFPNRAERLSRWGALADFASIDVYEWVRSTVPPSEYNALARQDAGNADIDPAVKASGEVALEETYARDRQWRLRPVAWSYSPVPTDVDWQDRSPMKYGANVTDTTGLAVSGTLSYLESGTFSSLGIVAGDRIGTWQHGLNPRPLAEGTVNDSFRLVLLGSEGTVPGFTVALTTSGYPATRFYGPLFVTTSPEMAVAVTDVDGVIIGYDHSYYLTVSNDLGQEETILAYVVRMPPPTDPTDPPLPPTIPVGPGQRFTYAFPLSGLEVTATYTGPVDPVLPAGLIAQRVVEALNGRFSLKDGVGVTWLTAAPAAGSYSNDELDPSFASSGGIGWRAWTVPTQAQLDADGRQPVSSWKPYIGDPAPFSPSYDQLQEAIAYQQAPLTLNNGVVVERYAPTWSEWQVLRNTRLTSTVTTTGPVTVAATSFGLTRFDLNRTGVYVNGIAQLRSAYTSDGPTLTLSSVGAGAVVDVIVLRYEPTAEELEFDPAVEENYTFQRQYKRDYEYVELQQRDRDGTPGATNYYFWVKNKTTAAGGKKLSVQSIRQQLRTGPPSFLTFQHLLPPTGGKPWHYDALTLSGLSYVVTKDDTFKLRFTRNFTLRDDPNDLDLKNTHTEWSLMRPGQKSRIPEALWLKLIDSTAGVDAASNPVPSLRRSLYDERRGTTTRFGFGAEQTLAPSSLLRTSLASTIVNTKLQLETPSGMVPDFIQFIDQEVDLLSIVGITDPAVDAALRASKVEQVEQSFFSDPALVRTSLTRIWAQASAQQVNELFFAALEDILASNFELTDIFKTSRLSLFSIQERRPQTVQTRYE